MWLLSNFNRLKKIFLFIYLFIYLFLVVSCLHCYVWAFSNCSEQGLFSSKGAQASHCGGFSCCRAQALGNEGFGVAAHILCCSLACRIFPHQGLNPCPMHWQLNSQSLDYQASPRYQTSEIQLCKTQS